MSTIHRSARTQVKHPDRVMIIGASGGIGQAMLDEVVQRFPGAQITATHFNTNPDMAEDRVTWRHLDVTNENAIESFAGEYESMDWIVNCVGMLHTENSGPEKNIRSVTAEFMLQNFYVNAMPTLLLARFFEKALRQSQAPVFVTVSAKVGSIEDNHLGGWYSYRMSKAALNMAIKTLSIEWNRTHSNGCVTALHPGTNDTQLSKPFQAGVSPDMLFKPATTATALVDLLLHLEPAQSGKFLAWDGTEIPW